MTSLNTQDGLLHMNVGVIVELKNLSQLSGE
jgi:hypothetical protein